MPKIPRFPPDALLSVEILAFQAVQLLDAAGPLQVFASANEFAVSKGNAPLYAPRLVTPGDTIVTASAGLGLVAAPLTHPETELDTLLIAGGPGVHDAAADPKLIEWVRARAERARRVASVCTGAFLLGAAGLLDGRRVATHWAHCDELARRFPAARVEANPIFVRDGAIWSSAGVTAGIDLTLALIEEDLGRTVAFEVARQLVVFLKRPGGQAQFSAALALQAAGDRFGRLHEWMSAHLAGDLSLPSLARQAGMSERSFTRHYSKTTGLTPARAVERLRVEEARRLLADTRLPVKRIAERCGFGSEETMRRSFVRVLSASPQEYRARFGGL